MAALLRAALAAGAMGLSTSRAPTHHDGDGNPVPSRAATDDELLRVVRRGRASSPGTQLEAIVPGCLNGFSDDEMSPARVDVERPRNGRSTGTCWASATPESYKHQLEASDRAAIAGGRVVALTLPQAMSIRLSFLNPG